MPVKPTILLVDDSRENLRCLRETLREVEAEVLEASSASEALERASGRHLALAILDVVMPTTGGHELARRLREQLADAEPVPILFVTSYPQDEAQALVGYDAGGVDLISRPCDSRLLLAKVRIFLDLDRARREVDEHRQRLAVLLESRTLELERATEHLRSEIVARDRADAQVRELARQRQLALDAARLGWWHYDPATRLAQYDLRYVEIFGVSGHERPNDEILRLLHPDDLPTVRAKVEAALDPVSPQPYLAEYRLNRPDGQQRWVEAHGLAVFEGEGGARHATSLVGTVADITERKRDEQRQRDINAELERLVAERTAGLAAANSELEAFAYSVSHDLRAPLRAIDGFSTLLLEEHTASLDDEGRRLFQIVRTNARNMAELIDDILSFSRLGRCGVARDVVNMQALCETVLAGLPPGSKDCELKFSVGALPMVRGDRSMIREALRNLIENAVKFTRTRKTAAIDISARLPDDRPDGQEPEEGAGLPPPGFALFVVRDNGVGFDMRYAAKLFGVFQRLHREEEFEGTGAGLAIVKRVVTRHGGAVGARGEPGRGASFWFTLPIRGETEHED